MFSSYTHRLARYPGRLVAAGLAAITFVSSPALAGDPVSVLVPGDLGLTIQEGIEIAALINATEVVIEPGVYFETIDLLGTEITVRGDINAPETVILDGQGLDVIGINAANGETPDTIVEGITIRNFGASGGVDDSHGVSVGFGAALTIRHCIFQNNETNLSGGAIALANNAALLLEDCVLTGNTAPLGEGGGLYVSTDSTAVVRRSTFSSNAAFTGGGIDVRDSAHCLVEDCSFISNISATDGGGINVDAAQLEFTRCLFDSNIAETDDGGGVRLEDGSSCTGDNSVFIRNHSGSQGGALRTHDVEFAVFHHCTFVGNTTESGSAVQAFSIGMDITNCVAWDNGGSVGGTVRMTYSMVDDGPPGEGNIFGDPLFVDAAQFDLRLTENSPAVDAGNSLSSINMAADFAGMQRGVDAGFDNGGVAVFGVTVDMGAHELQLDVPPTTCDGDTNHDGVVDVNDLLILLGAWGVCK